MSPDYTECPHCRSKNIKKLVGADEPTRHYGRLACNSCGRWITWLPDPSVTACYEKRKMLIHHLLNTDEVNDDKTEFLQDIQPERWLTHRQINWLDSISFRILGELSPVPMQSPLS